jgi:hypothetical protein
MTDRFATTARLMAEVCGLPSYPFAVVAHPISSDSDDALRTKAHATLNQFVSIVRKRPLHRW